MNLLLGFARALACRLHHKILGKAFAIMGGACMVVTMLAGMQEVIAVEQHVIEHNDKASNVIFVTATRSEQKDTHVAASTGKKDHKEIELDDPVLQKDLLNSIAGVRISQTGSTIGHMTSIRMPTNTDPVYLFLQDGIPVQSSGFFNRGFKS